MGVEEEVRVMLGLWAPEGDERCCLHVVTSRLRRSELKCWGVRVQMG